MKRVAISPESLVDLLSDQTTWKITAGVPKDAEFRGVTIDPYVNVINIFVEHESFPEEKEGEVYPKLDIYFKRLK